MQAMEDMIIQKGDIGVAGIVKVDGFLNHQLDVAFLDVLGEEFYRLFKDAGITRILTIEASGIALASAAARFLRVPVVFAKKSVSLNLDGAAYESRVYSYTKQREYHIRVSRKYLTVSDTVLLIDDFLAKGKAMLGLLNICRQAGAAVAGIGCAVEKGFQGGGDQLRREGYRVESLAIVESMEDGKISFRH